MMNDKKLTLSTAQEKSAANKQICMNVDGCTVKLNLTVNKSEMAKIEIVKKMILHGLAKV